jgi:hypothetical protein
VPYLVITPVAVEKLDLSESRPKRSEQKCTGDRRKSSIGHPDATHFRRKFCERVFQQLRLISSAILIASVQGLERASVWRASGFQLFTQSKKAIK